MSPPLQDHEVQNYGQHAFEINEITTRGDDFDYVGWAFQVAQDGKPQFRMAITTAGLTREGDRDALREWGLKWVHTMIDSGNYDANGDYCGSTDLGGIMVQKPSGRASGSDQSYDSRNRAD